MHTATWGGAGRSGAGRQRVMKGAPGPACTLDRTPSHPAAAATHPHEHLARRRHSLPLAVAPDAPSRACGALPPTQTRARHDDAALASSGPLGRGFEAPLAGLVRWGRRGPACRPAPRLWHVGRCLGRGGRAQSKRRHLARELPRLPRPPAGLHIAQAAAGTLPGSNEAGSGCRACCTAAAARSLAEPPSRPPSSLLRPHSHSPPPGSQVARDRRVPRLAARRL